MIRGLIVVAVLMLGACTPQKTPKENGQAPQVITPDWSVAQTLVALNHPLVAMGEIDNYTNWASESIHADVIDIGLRFSPNAELFSQLNADVIIDNAFYAHLRTLYRDIPYQEVSLKVGDVAMWEDFVTYTHQIAQIVHQEAKAAQYLTDSKQTMINNGQQFHQKYPSINKIAVIQFANAQNYRLYAANSLFKVAADEMGLSLYTPKQGNAWGFVDQNLGELTNLPFDVCLVVVSPFSQMLQYELENSQLWRKLGFGSSRCMMVIPPVWIYGGVPSLVGFSHQLVMADVMGGLS